jgi:hypothetical protein
VEIDLRAVVRSFWVRGPYEEEEETSAGYVINNAYFLLMQHLQSPIEKRMGTS